MKNQTEQQLAGCLALAGLQQDVRQAHSVEELGFIMVNRTMKILPATTILFWQQSSKGKGECKLASGVAQIDPQAPFIIWANRILKILAADKAEDQVHQIASRDIEAPEANEWSEWLPQQALWLPITNIDGSCYGGLLLVREQEWQDSDLALAYELGQIFAHGWSALGNNSKAGTNRQTTWSGTLSALAVLLLVAALFIVEVKQSVLAPATVVPQNPDVVTAPLDGAIKKIEVEPNSPVESGQILFRMEQSEIRNRRDVTKLVLQVTQERYLKAQKMAFSDPDTKASLSLLQSQITQHSAEAAYAQELLGRTVVQAKSAGVALFSNSSDWQGRPVAVGEQVMIIANHDHVELEILLPVEDAIIMQPGAEVLLFLNSDPLNPLEAKLQYSSYEASVNQGGLLAYRLIAQFPKQTKPARIGLKGTAKILGEKTSIFYYLFRRPITALRQAIGF
jgi:hypothetical protein